MTTTHILATLCCIFALVGLGFFFAFAWSKRRYDNLVEDLKPYEYWTEFSKGIYSISLTTNLYQKTSGSGYEPIGTVANHFSEFSKSNLEAILEDHFYGNIDTRKYIGVKIVSANCNSNAVAIRSISGKLFYVMRSEIPQFPKKVTLEFKVQEEKENS